jgi:hypothetical protein
MDGHLYSRDGMSPNAPDGRQWRAIDGPLTRALTVTNQAVLGVCVCVCV